MIYFEIWKIDILGQWYRFCNMSVRNLLNLRHSKYFDDERGRLLVMKTWKAIFYSFVLKDDISSTASTIQEDARCETPPSQYKKAARGKPRTKKCKLQFKCTNYIKVIIKKHNIQIKNLQMQTLIYFKLLKNIIIQCIHIINVTN